MKTAVGRTGISLGVAVSKALGLDLSFHRTWLEVLVRPIGGTMLIKSYRFMRLEAGDGETRIEKRTSGSEGKLKTLGKAIIHRPFNGKPGKGLEQTKADITGIVMCFREELLSLVELEKKIVEAQNAVKKYTRDLNRYNLTNSKDFLDLVGKCASGLLKTEDHNLPKKYINEPGEIISDLDKVDKSIYNVFKTCKELESIQNSYIKTLFDFVNSSFKSWVENNGKDKISFLSFKRNEVTKDLLRRIRKYVNENCELKDLIAFDVNKIDNNEIDFSVKLKPKIIEEKQGLSLKNKIIVGGKGLLEFSSERIFKTKGMIDDNVWSEKDKGGILVSMDKERSFSLANDGTFKQQYQYASDIVEHIKMHLRTSIWTTIK